MTRTTQHPRFAAVLALGGLAVGAEVWLLQGAAARAGRELAALEQAKQQRDWLARQSPAPSLENETAVAADVAAAENALAAWRDALASRAPAAPVPAKPLDAYFEIATFVEQTRALAGRLQVGLRPDERWGFATYANEGPGPDVLPVVHRQRLAIQRLVETLLGARPVAVLAVQRERPAPAAPQSGRDAPADFFTPEPAPSARTGGLCSGTCYRLEFTGRTPVLRSFLNSLAALSPPVLVHRIEVEPVPDKTDGPAPALPAAAPDGPVPLVAGTLSKFAVVVECVELLPAPAPAS